MNELKLVFIHFRGNEWKGEKNNYQLLFATEEDMELFDDDSWGVFPANGIPTPPTSEYITLVMDIETEMNLILSQNSAIYRMYDAVDGVIPLGYEDINNYDYYPENRLVLRYGMTKDEVEERLSLSDISPLIHLNDEKEIE